MKEIRTIGKERVALIQLYDAIHLYYSKSYISAITLAAVAEEILGKLSDEKYSGIVARKAKNNYANTNASLIARFLPNHPRKNGLNQEQEKHLRKIEQLYLQGRNRTRNQLKHKDEGEEDVQFENFRKTAIDHMAGAIVNYKLLTGKLPANEIIRKFCVESGLS